MGLGDLFRRKKASAPEDSAAFVKSGRVLGVRSREVAEQLPRSFPPDTTHPRRNAVTACPACGGKLEEHVFTTCPEYGAPVELWEEVPISFDGWVCSACRHLVGPRFLEPNEAQKLLDEGIACARRGDFDRAEFCLRRLASSWPGFILGRVNLASLYQDKLRAEQQGRARRAVIDRWIRVIEQELTAAAACSGPPDPPVHVHLSLARLYANTGDEPRARAALSKLESDTRLSDDERAEVNEIAARLDRGEHLYALGVAAIQPFMRLHDVPRRAVDTEGEQAIDRGIGLLSEFVARHPEAWNAHWIIGKGWEARDDYERAREAFAKAFAIAPDKADVANEYANACMRLGRLDEAVSIAKDASRARPEDAGLIANVALALLLAGDLDEAKRTVAEARAKDPTDPVTEQLEAAIDDVAAGKLPKPKSLTELEASVTRQRS